MNLTVAQIREIKAIITKAHEDWNDCSASAATFDILTLLSAENEPPAKPTAREKFEREYGTQIDSILDNNTRYVRALRDVYELAKITGYGKGLTDMDPDRVGLAASKAIVESRRTRDSWAD